jgi:hypothetical protein
MTDAMGMIIESFVAVLLMLTIGYCMMLNRRLKLLKGDEDALRATIAELVTATEIAERAIGLGERLARAERLCAELDRRLNTGKDVLGHLSQAATSSRRLEDANPALQDAQAIAAAAGAFAERLRSKVFGLAA